MLHWDADRALEEAQLFPNAAFSLTPPFRKAHYPLTGSQLDKNTSSSLTKTHVPNLQKDSWFQH